MKKCPNPLCPYVAEKRPHPNTCPICKAMMGPVLKPDTGPKTKKVPKKRVTANHPTVEIEPGLFSVQYHQHNRFGSFILKAVINCHYV
jgi:hypothetical protein